jgi:hypothetical protein
VGVLIEQCPGAQATPQLRALVSGLTAAHPERRPASANQAMKILDGAPTEPTRVMEASAAPTIPRIPATRRQIKLSPSRSRVATLAVIVVLLIVLIVPTAPGGGGSRAQTSAPAKANPNAPLSSQLSQLDRAIDRSHR